MPQFSGNGQHCSLGTLPVLQHYPSAATALGTELTQKLACFVTFLPLLLLECLNSGLGSSVRSHWNFQRPHRKNNTNTVNVLYPVFSCSKQNCAVFPLIADFFFFFSTLSHQGFCQTTSCLIMKRWSIGHRLLPLPIVPYTQAQPQWPRIHWLLSSRRDTVRPSSPLRCLQSLTVCAVDPA